MRSLHGAVALVTGASRGVGAATAVALAEAGCAAVACAARSTMASPAPTPGTLDSTCAAVQAAGAQALAVPTDLAHAPEVAAMVAATVAEFGRLDVLVNNAAITFPGDLALFPERLALVLDVDLLAPVLAVQAALPYLRASPLGGAVVNVSSAAAMTPFPGLMAYGMAKVGLERFTVDAARQLAGDGVSVNCFRIDVPVASEGFLAQAPELDPSDWEPPAVAAEGIVWVLRQPPSFTGWRLSMAALRTSEGIMASRAQRTFAPVLPTALADGPG